MMLPYFLITNTNWAKSPSHSAVSSCDLLLKRCYFSHCGPGEGYCFESGSPVFTEQREFTTRPHALCLGVGAVCGLRGSLQLAWFGVDERMECVAPSVVVWGSPLARSIGQPPPWQPTAALAAAPTHGYHNALLVKECIRPDDAQYKPLLVFHSWLRIPPTITHTAFYFCSLSLACHIICDATWLLCQSSHNNVGFDFCTQWCCKKTASWKKFYGYYVNSFICPSSPHSMLT